MTKHQRPNLVYDFAGFSARAPNQQIPGDRLAAQFAEHAGAIVKLQQALEGLDAPITAADLDPKLFREIAKEAKDSLEKLAQDSARAAGRAASSAQHAVNQAAEARDAAKPLLSRAEQILAAERDALAILEEQRIALHLLERKLEDLKAAGPGLQVRTDPVGLLGPNAGGKHSADALGAAATAADYAQVSIHWSEWMGPGGIYQGGPAGASDIIPNNILAINAISGDHWSSRWWAHKAAEYVNGFLYGYYMGPHPQPPIQAIGGGPIPVGSYYFNTSNNVMYVWTGTEWIPFNTPQKASAVSLWYRAGTGQTVFPLTVPDLFGQSIPGLDPAGTQPIEVHLRGELLLPTSGPVTGDYFVDYPNSTVEIGPPQPIPGSLVAIDVLIDPALLAPGAVKVIKLKPLVFDGVRTTFNLLDDFDNSVVTASSASQLFTVVDGVDQEPGADFTIGTAGQAIIFNEAPRADAKSFIMFFEAAGGVAGQIYTDSTLTGDGTQTRPLSVVQQVLGAFDAQAGTTLFTAASGIPDAAPLPPASTVGVGEYVIVHVAGTPTQGPPETLVPAEVGDWWISDGNQWHLFPIGGAGMDEPPPDDKGYVRTTHLDGVSQWVPPAETQIDFGTGLTKDETVFPPIVNLQPALDYAIGGLLEPPQDGLAYSRQFDALNQVWVWTPALTAGLQITSIIPDKAIYGPGEPLLTVHAYGSEFTATTVAVLDGRDVATDVLSATELTFVLNPAVPINEQFHIITVRDPAAVPPDLVDGLGAEQFDFIKASTEVDYGRGLSLDTLPTPPIVNLDPAGPTNMGGVIVPLRDRTTNGLVIDMGNEALGDPATGHLTAPPATAELLGTVCVPARSPGQGLVLGDDGMLRAPLATDQHAGAITEPSEPNVPHGRVKDPVTGLYHWEEILGGFEEPPMEPVQTWGRSSGGARGWLPLPDGGVEAGVGLYKTEDPATLHLNIASRNDLGGVIIAPQPGLAIDQTGNLTLARATPEDIGGVQDAPRDDTGKRLFARQWGQWKEIEGEGGMEEPPAEPVGMWGRTSAGARGWALIDQTGALIAGNTPTETGVIYVPDDRGLNLSPDGAVTLRPAGQYPDLGGMFEAPLNDGPYVRDNGQWAKLPEAASDFVTVGRSPIQALDEGFDDVLQKRSLFVPLATDFLAGAIVEPPADGAQYARTNDAANGPAWVENIAKGVHTDDAPPMTPSDGALWWKSSTGALYVFYEDIDSGQWVQVNGTPSPDATISTGDTPPSNPRPNQLWFESDRGSLFFWYADADSSQWVEILGGSGGTAGSAPPVDLTGYATEAWTTDQIANAVIDAQAFVTAAAEKQAGHDTDLCQQALKAVEGLAVSVKQLQKGHLALKARIQKLEAR